MIDISHHQGNVKLDQVKQSGINYIMIKSSEGENYKDPKFD